MKQPIPYVVARILLASVFVGLGGERLLVKVGALTGRTAPGAAGVALSAFEVLAGIAIMLGWQVGRLSLLLAVFLIVDAFIAHPFWNFSGPEQRGELLHFLKNLSIIGGLLLLSWTEAHRPDTKAPGELR
ncbi:DoxX family protein [Luteolibacter flavescens]|uniref:DoxX family protein n=1 Tax=Luteolibacter flavescens TaxID=1859460 RepID=A0ABT3FR77_9BACT|nr:DoxX family protein [Luteolibacter flavescens]MCW1886083.1 DoxX family protein [Luteolibacter flavescens]